MALKEIIVILTGYYNKYNSVDLITTKYCIFLTFLLLSSTLSYFPLDSHSLSFSHATIHLCDSWACVGARGPMGSWSLHLCNFSSGPHDEDSSETPKKTTVQTAGQPPSLPAQHDPEVCGSTRMALIVKCFTLCLLIFPKFYLRYWILSPLQASKKNLQIKTSESEEQLQFFSAISL